MYLLPLALAALGILLDLLSIVALVATFARHRWYSGFPVVPLLFYVPAAVLSALGWHPPRFSLSEMLVMLGALCALHVLIHWLHATLGARLQGGSR
jgi:hypothetical protein